MARRTLIPIGPFHPLQEEAEFFQLTVEGETVVDIDVRISYNHRGIEGVAMKRTWDCPGLAWELRVESDEGLDLAETAQPDRKLEFMLRESDSEHYIVARLPAGHDGRNPLAGAKPVLLWRPSALAGCGCARPCRACST